MLRNGTNAWLMYLRHHEGDNGFTSQGETGRIGVASYELSNGQVDEYPLSWCIEIEQCYKALAYFFVNEGSKPEWVSGMKAESQSICSERPNQSFEPTATGTPVSASQLQR